jgi:hypothetical protein
VSVHGIAALTTTREPPTPPTPIAAPPTPTARANATNRRALPPQHLHPPKKLNPFLTTTAALVTKTPTQNRSSTSSTPRPPPLTPRATRAWYCSAA